MLDVLSCEVIEVGLMNKLPPIPGEDRERERERERVKSEGVERKGGRRGEGNS